MGTINTRHGIDNEGSPFLKNVTINLSRGEIAHLRERGQLHVHVQDRENKEVYLTILEKKDK